jgi:hypothetical protein
MSYEVMLFLWIVYACICGYWEAYFWEASSKSDRILGWIHNVFFLERLIVGVVFAVSCSSTLQWIVGTLCALGCIFPFFHDGFYYLTRNKITPNLYPKKFMDYTQKSTAKTDVLWTWEGRCVFLSIGLCYFVVKIFM